MKNQIISLKKGVQAFARPRKVMQLLFAAILFAGTATQAQVYQASSRTDYVYPAFPTAYNGLHQNETKYLSNASYPSIHYHGDYVFASGWSSDIDGGFTAGTMDAAGNYTGTATVQLLDKIDVQVGFLESSTNTYIVVSYFNNTTSNYGFSLYFFNSGTATHIYDYEFLDPGFPNLPTSAMSTMTHNRISMDVNKDGDKVAFALTNGATERMYASVGMLDAVNHRITLNATNFFRAITSGPSGGCDVSDCPWPAGYDPTVFTYEISNNPSHFLYVCPSGNWVFSRFDISNPLIEIMAQSSISSPPSAIRYKQLFPEVSFSSNNLNFAFYCPGARVGSSSGLDEIYIIPNVPFNDFFSQTGVFNSANVIEDGLIGTGSFGACFPAVIYCAHPFVAYHTNPGLATRNIRDATGGGGWAATPALTPTGDLRFNMDMPDNYTGEWAITLKNETSPGLNRIEARYNNLTGTNRSVFVNTTPFNPSIATFNNDDPDIAYNNTGNRLNLVWGSKGNPAFTTNTKSLLGVVLTTASTPVRTSTAHYLVVTEFPDLNFGSLKVLSALSKRTANMTGLYTSFCQTEDDLAALTFSIFHNQHNWSSLVWRSTGETEETRTRLAGGDTKVGPSPFRHSIRLLADDGTAQYNIHMFDQVGRQVHSISGTTAEINQYFDHKLEDLSSGVYLIKVSDPQGKTDTHKLLKE